MLRYYIYATAIKSKINHHTYPALSKEIKLLRLNVEQFLINYERLKISTCEARWKTRAPENKMAMQTHKPMLAGLNV